MKNYDTDCFWKRISNYESKYTKLYQKHISNSIGAKFVSIDNRSTLSTDIFTDNNCINKFIKWIFKQQEKINQIINEHFNKKLKMIIEDEKTYQDSQDCLICNEKLDKTNVRDHFHITGKFRGVAHNQCNLK